MKTPSQLDADRLEDSKLACLSFAVVAGAPCSEPGHGKKQVKPRPPTNLAKVEPMLDGKWLTAQRLSICYCTWRLVNTLAGDMICAGFGARVCADSLPGAIFASARVQT